jgi:hypothetical protein
MNDSDRDGHRIALAVRWLRHLRTGEDVELVSRMSDGGARIAWAEDVAVTTSARRIGRTPEGFAFHLRRLDRAGYREGRERRGA